MIEMLGGWPERSDNHQSCDLISVMTNNSDSAFDFDIEFFS